MILLINNTTNKSISFEFKDIESHKLEIICGTCKASFLRKPTEHIKGSLFGTTLIFEFSETPENLERFNDFLYHWFDKSLIRGAFEFR